MKKIFIFSLFIIFAGLITGLVFTQNNKGEMADNNRDSYLSATFAGGCFWCVEADFEKVDGVIEAVSGYTGGKEIDPTYKDVSYGRTSHLEAVQVVFDPQKISYEELLEAFWRQIDPTDKGGQFVDRGKQYGTAIFYHDDEQKQLARKSKKDLQKSGVFRKSIVTEIRELSVFYEAEDYHQDFYKKSPGRYNSYRSGSGRDQFIEKYWGDKTSEYMKPKGSELKKSLSALQYRVTQENGTEPAFNNEYWDNKKDGIYVDIVSGEPLFSSTDKFVSGTGWPSFTKPLVSENVIDVEDRGFGMVRTEVRSKAGDSHLGHVFSDGPAPTGLRYCINSASLRFIPKKDLAEEGYGDYLKLFKD